MSTRCFVVDSESFSQLPESQSEVAQVVRADVEELKSIWLPGGYRESPWTGKLKSRGLLDHLKLNLVDYCTFGMPYRKRTAIWTNTDWIPSRPLCKHDCASSRNGKHTARAQQGGPGPSFSQRELYRIPAGLCDEIAEFCGQPKGSLKVQA